MTDAATLSRRGFIALPLVIAACKPGPEILELTGLTMGTSWRVVATDSTGKLAKADFDKMFKDMDRDEDGTITAEELRPQWGGRGGRRERRGEKGDGKDV